MPTRAQVWTWIAAVSLLAPSMAAGQDRTEREVVELIVRDGPFARLFSTEFAGRAGAALKGGPALSVGG